MTATEPRITRGDIEAKLSEIQTELDRETEQAKGVGLVVGAAVVVGVVMAAYLIGRRKGRRRQAVVEVFRV